MSEVDISMVASRLERRFGLGTHPTMRKALYDRLEQIVEDHGERAYHIIAATAADAVGKTQPDHYFCKVVMLRLGERGLLPVHDL